jgi:formamidopyrimidine-DNA glycosylase
MGIVLHVLIPVHGYSIAKFALHGYVRKTRKEKFMPELPEVETVRRGLEPVLTGETFTKVELRRANLRFAFPDNFIARLEGKTCLQLHRRAKYLCADLSSGETLIMHLGMSGRFLIKEHQTSGMIAHEAFHHTEKAGQNHDHVVMHLSNGAKITYNDARRFGFMDLVATDGLAECLHFRNMGIEPLGNGFSGEALKALLAGKKAPLKAALLDQKYIAGLGNIYVCEALFRAKLSPYTQAGQLTLSEAENLALIIRAVLEEALAAGGSSLRDFASTDGSLGYFQHRFKVYGREGEACITPHCNGVITRSIQAGRSTFFCENCQPLHVS